MEEAIATVAATHATNRDSETASWEPRGKKCSPSRGGGGDHLGIVVFFPGEARRSFVARGLSTSSSSAREEREAALVRLVCSRAFPNWEVGNGRFGFRVCG
jgi:hypothetical protein